MLLDARLPGIGGPEACRRLRASHPSVRVIVVSTFSDEDLVDACIMAGAKGYVIKVIESFDLKRSIRAVHRGEGVLAPSVGGKVLDWVRAQDRPSGPVGPPLNATQLAILRLISEGLTNAEIPARVHLSQNTVKSHVQQIFRKLEVRNRVGAALRATKEGWV